MEKLFENQQALALFLLFFVPGFISLKTYDQLVPGETRDFSKAIYDAIAYSALNFGLLFWLFDFILSHSLARFWWYCSWFMVLVIFPVAWPILLITIRRHRCITKFMLNPNPRAWDCLFQKRECYWVIVHLLRMSGDSEGFTHLNPSHRAAQRPRKSISKRPGI
jgi:hypothetical protein